MITVEENNERIAQLITVGSTANELGNVLSAIGLICAEALKPLREWSAQFYVDSGLSQRAAVKSGLEAGIITERTARRLIDSLP